MGLQAVIAGVGGDIWATARNLALWPWPAVVYGARHSRFTWRDYRVFTKKLLPGDFLLMRAEPYFLSNAAISGTAFKHLAVYVGAVEGDFDAETRFIDNPLPMGTDYRHTGRAKDGLHERVIVHAISEGVVCQDLGEVLFHEDYVCAVRPWKNEHEQDEIVERAISRVGIPYDFEFKASPKALYCTELGGWCCKRVGIEPPKKVLKVNNLLGLVLPLARFHAPVWIADGFLVYNTVCFSKSCGEKSFAGKLNASQETKNFFRGA